MYVELGHFLLIAATVLALLQAVIPLVGAHQNWRGWMSAGITLTHLQFIFIAGSFIALTLAFVASDFSVRVVAMNSHTDKPLIYKISGVWGNHEGSMLLWVSILALFGAAVAWGSAHMPQQLRARVIGVQGAVGFAFYLFIVLTSNPFWRLENPPINGNGLNPILQDPGLAFHPPMLYLGYVGLSVAYSFAIAALIDGRVDAAWARFVRPWTLAAWIFLTLGIALGSWWAYYELGWGGFWFWDPVENASFMPWLIAVALLHSALVVEKRDTLKSWTILLAIVGFSFSLIGTFIVRSGLLTSVHSFASDPTRGLFMLGILAVAILVGLVLFAWRAPQLTSSSAFAPVSRESAIVMNNLLLSVACGVVFFGTMWPMVVEAVTGQKLSVGEPFFDASFTPFMMALAVLLPVGAMMPWKRAKLGKTLRDMWGVLVLVGAVGALIFTLQTGYSILAPVAFMLGSWIIFGSFFEIWRRAGGKRFRLGRLRGLPRADWGKWTAHIGFAVIIIGIGGVRAWQIEDIRAAAPGASYEVGAYDIDFLRADEGDGPNYSYTRGTFAISRDGVLITEAEPELRQYPVEGAETSEAAIFPYRLGDLYVVMRPPQLQPGESRATNVDEWSIYFYVKPLVNLLWFGSFLCALGGFLSLSDRRMRVARAGRKETQAKTVAS